jgi:hypothetical protein
MSSFTSVEDMLDGAKPLEAFQPTVPMPAQPSVLDRFAPIMEEVPYAPGERLPLNVAARWLLLAIVGTWAVLIGIVWGLYEGLAYFFPSLV